MSVGHRGQKFIGNESLAKALLTRVRTSSFLYPTSSKFQKAEAFLRRSGNQFLDIYQSLNCRDHIEPSLSITPVSPPGAVDHRHLVPPLPRTLVEEPFGAGARAEALRYSRPEYSGVGHKAPKKFQRTNAETHESRHIGSAQTFVMLTSTPPHAVVLSCFPFSSDYPKAFRLDTRVSKRPSFPPSREKKVECLYPRSCQFNVCAESAGVSKCERWESSPRILSLCGEFSVLCPARGSWVHRNSGTRHAHSLAQPN